MTITPGTPEDWADTNPESTTPERILPTLEGVTPSATKVAMVCYAVGAASKCWEHPERAGVFDSDRASQIVTELCVALGVEQQGDAAPESARPATLTGERLEKFYRTDAAHERLGRTVAEHMLAEIYERLLQSYVSTPQERYESLLARCPGLLELVPLRELASFLGVRPETLSRIRRRVR